MLTEATAAGRAPRRLPRLPVDPRAALVDRVIGGVRPSWRAGVQWRTLRRRGEIEYRVVHTLVRRGDTVVDIGANWGLYSYRLSRLVGPLGRVYAFEPSPTMRAALRRLAGLANVTVVDAGLSDHEGDSELHVPIVGGRRVDYLASLAIRPNAELEHQSFGVRLKRLDDVLAREGAGVSFIKCDVEGHELAVLRGAEEILRRARPRLLVEIEQRHTQLDIAETFGLLREHRYRGYMLAGEILRPLEEFDVQRDQLDLLDDLSNVRPGYVNQFVFVPAELPSELDAWTRPR